MLGKEDVWEAERGCLFKSDQEQKTLDQRLSEQKRLDPVNSAKFMGEINSDMAKNKLTEEEFAVQDELAQFSRDPDAQGQVAAFMQLGQGLLRRRNVLMGKLAQITHDPEHRDVFFIGDMEDG